MDELEFRVLGPLHVSRQDREFSLGQRRDRLILGVLLLEPGRMVPVARLLDLAWHGQSPPRTARNALQVCISRLRGVLGAAAPIVHVGDSYRLDVDPHAVDVHTFRFLVTEASRVQGAARSQLLRRALQLWQGPLLAGTLTDELRQAVFAGLAEERMQAVEECLAAELDLGMHAQVTAELTDLVAAHPTRERLAGQLMLALFRSGRQGESLAVFRRIRDILGNELGIDPTSDLTGLHQLILRNDPAIVLGAAQEEPQVQPRELPAKVASFMGRGRALTALNEWCGDHESPSGAMVISVVAGTAGVGKTDTGL